MLCRRWWAKRAWSWPLSRKSEVVADCLIVGERALRDTITHLADDNGFSGSRLAR